jgi:hypothetical protein
MAGGFLKGKAALRFMHRPQLRKTANAEECFKLAERTYGNSNSLFAVWYGQLLSYPIGVTEVPPVVEQEENSTGRDPAVIKKNIADDFMVRVLSRPIS